MLCALHRGQGRAISAAAVWVARGHTAIISWFQLVNLAGGSLSETFSAFNLRPMAESPPPHDNKLCAGGQRRCTELLSAKLVRQLRSR